jgi:hypothetical protein
MQILETVEEDLQSSKMLLASDRHIPSEMMAKPTAPYIPSSLYGVLPGGFSNPTTEVKAKLFELELEKEES